MKKIFLSLVLSVFWGLQASAAILNFYSNPRVPQPLFHVSLEYKGYLYEADPRAGGRRLPLAEVTEIPDIRIEISDALVDEQALLAQLGLPFDFNFVWDNDKTYCAKLVGKALDIPPQPMNFAGTHYVKYYPQWLQRHDPGLSPDQIYDFGVQHALRIMRKAL